MSDCVHSCFTSTLVPWKMQDQVFRWNVNPSTRNCCLCNACTKTYKHLLYDCQKTAPFGRSCGDTLLVMSWPTTSLILIWCNGVSVWLLNRRQLYLLTPYSKNSGELVRLPVCVWNTVTLYWYPYAISYSTFKVCHLKKKKVIGSTSIPV